VWANPDVLEPGPRPPALASRGNRPGHRRRAGHLPPDRPANPEGGAKNPSRTSAPARPYLRVHVQPLPSDGITSLWRGASAPRDCSPPGLDPSPEHLMKPPVASRVPLVLPPRHTRRTDSVCPLGSPPAHRKPGLPPPAFARPPVPAGVPVASPRKTLPSAPGFGYNPHSS